MVFPGTSLDPAFLPSHWEDIEKISRGEALYVVNRYIGADGGYLDDLSYRTNEEFYQEFCNIELTNNLTEKNNET